MGALQVVTVLLRQLFQSRAALAAENPMWKKQERYTPEKVRLARDADREA